MKVQSVGFDLDLDNVFVGTTNDDNNDVLKDFADDFCCVDWMAAIELEVSDQTFDLVYRFTPKGYLEYYAKNKCMLCDKKIAVKTENVTVYPDLGVIMHQKCFQQTRVEMCKTCFGPVPACVWDSLLDHSIYLPSDEHSHFHDGSGSCFVIDNQFEQLAPRATLRGSKRIYAERAQLLDEYFATNTTHKNWYEMMQKHISLNLSVEAVVKLVGDIAPMQLQAFSPFLRMYFYQSAAKFYNEPVEKLLMLTILENPSFNWEKSLPWVRERLKISFGIDEERILKYVAEKTPEDILNACATIQNEIDSFRKKPKNRAI